jgi:hypothetical protein
LFGSGLPIHPDLFAQSNFRLFCSHNSFLSGTETTSFAVQCSASIQQKTRRPFGMWTLMVTRGRLNFDNDKRYGIPERAAAPRSHATQDRLTHFRQFMFCRIED